jgi:hypothetical protein
MSGYGGIADVLAHLSKCLLIAEAVEEVPRTRILETMIQNPGRY